MALEKPKASDLFSDAESPKAAAIRQEEFDVEIAKSMASAITNPGDIAAIKSGVATFAQASGNVTAQLEALASNKSLTGDAAAGLQSALAAQRMAKIGRAHV